MNKINSVIVGFGSIGKKHLEQHLRFSDHISIVDPRKIPQSEIIEAQKMASIECYANISKIPKNIKFEYATISNWGPDHLATIKLLSNIGIHKFILEKPAVDSLKEIEQLRRLRDSNGLKILSHFQLSSSKIIELISCLQSNLFIGKPKLIVVSGGVKCLATVGIHYVDLANILFKNRPVKVNANLNNDFINPRNAKFLYLDGSINYEYPGKEYLSLNFSNQSHISDQLMIYFESYLAKVENNEIIVSKIPDSIDLTRKTKTSTPEELVLRDHIYPAQSGNYGSNRIYDCLMASLNLKCPDVVNDFGSTEDILIALISNKLAKVINYESLDQIPIELRSLKWKIS